jgi:Tfp pilus assembly protein PilF
MIKKLSILIFIFLNCVSLSFSAANNSEEAAQIHLKALVLEGQNNILEASRAYAKAVSLKPNIRYIYIDWGVFLAKRGHLKLAAAQFKKATKIVSIKKSDTPLKVAYYNLGTTLLKLTRFKQAEVALLHAIKIDSNYFEAYYNLAELYRKTNNFKGAAKAYRKASEIKPKNMNSRINYAGALYKLGYKNKSMKVLKQVLVIDPNNKEAKRVLDYILKN